MKRNNGRKWRKSGILCWMLVLMMLMTSIQVPAAVFEAPADTGELFSSGTEDSYVEPEGDNPSASWNDGHLSGVSGTLEGTQDAGNGSSAVTGESGENGEGAEQEILRFSEDGVAAASIIHEGDPVTIKFADPTGKAFYNDLEINTKMGDSVEIPGVPGYEDAEGSGWKMELEAPDEDIYFEGGETLKLSMDEDLDEYIVDGVLTLYAVQGKEMCTLTFYNNSGTGVFNGGQVKVVKGTVITLPDFPSSKYVNFGWTTVKKGTTVQFDIGEKYTVNRSMNLYMIRYATAKVMKVTFLNPSGSSNASFKALNTQVLKGNKVKLPSPPVVCGYTNLGWSTKKNATSATYLAGRSITVNKNLTLYAVRKKVPTYSVSFNNNSGTSTSKVYTSLNKKVAQNSYVILPDLPKAAGYQNVGWTTTRKGTTPVYKEGAKVKVTKNLKFYTVRKKSKYYTASFYLNNGSTNTAYKALQVKVEEDNMITLPSVPAKSGYLNLGWTTKKNGTSVTNREGTKYNMIKNVSFYAVQKQAAQVILHKQDGSPYRTHSVGQGDYFELPSATSKQPYTFMGWSARANQYVNPDYEAGEKIKVNGEVHLYAVVFNRTAEEDISALNLAQPDLRRNYKQIIFVGDSRTNRMKLTLDAQFGTAITNGVTFISQEGGGYSWLKSIGYTSLMSAVGSGSTGILDKPIAVVFNLGVNDLAYTASYVNYMQALADELQAKGCKLFYMSVNPLNSKLITASGHAARTEAAVRSFNSTIYNSLCTGGKYTYIDTYSWLMSTGYGTDSGRGIDSGFDDGLHYTTKTYKRIYDYCIRKLNGY
ncbi:MAG: InlB B-repeat-containing protein [Eubacteriales bacterium]|nr:InlB B-repeat-containing protein [Eubacteriales bacterium]